MSEAAVFGSGEKQRGSTSTLTVHLPSRVKNVRTGMSGTGWAKATRGASSRQRR